MNSTIQKQNNGPTTVKEYLDNQFDIIPCHNDSRKPIGDNWQNRKIDHQSEWQPGNNIGCRLENIIDIDFDNPTANKFINYLPPYGASFGKGSRNITHVLFKGKAKAEKFVIPKGFAKYTSHFKDPHENTIIETRSGKSLQSIMPGSVVESKKVFWSRYESISPYPLPDKINLHVGKIALATAFTLFYPTQGSRDDYCYAIAGTLARYTKWSDNEIDEFVLDIAVASNDDDAKDRKNKGTNARIALEKEGNVFGVPTLAQILGVDEEWIHELLEWVGVKKPNKYLIKLRNDHVYVVDSASMFNIHSKLDQKKDEFNSLHLRNFPGGKNKDLAFQSLMKDRDFQDRIVVGRAVLPGYEYPIAKIEKHLYLAPGNYLNLYPGPPFEPIKGDVSLWLETMQKVFLPWQWELLEQFFGAVIQKTFKYLLKLTPEQSREMGEESKIQFGPLVVGPEGTLKKGLSRTIERILGAEHCDINATFDQMIEKHSEVILNQLFVFINEVVTTGEVTKKTEISNKLKPFWTDERTKINPKNIRPFKYWNNCNGTMFSNEKDCLHIGKSARRYMVIHQDLSVKDLQKLNDDGTFRRFYEYINSDKIAHVFYYFLYEVKIKDWRIWNGGRAPSTIDLKTMQDGSDHPIASKLQRALDARTEPFDTRFVGFASIDSIMDYARERWKMPTMNEKYINSWIKENAKPWKNGKLEKQIVHAELGRPRVYKLINYPCLDELSESELGNLYKFDYFDLQKSLHGFTVNNRPFDDVFSTDAKQKERRAQYAKELIEFYLAPGGSPYRAQIKIAEILLTLIKADKDYNKAIRDSKEEGIIGEKKINYEKLAEQVIEIANNKVKNLTKQMLDEK